MGQSCLHMESLSAPSLDCNSTSCCASFACKCKFFVCTGRGAARVPRQVGSEGVIYSKSVKSLADLRDDDTAAAEEAEAQGGECTCCYEEPWLASLCLPSEMQQ